MSAAAISNLEPAVPQNSDAPVAMPKPASDKQCAANKFDSVLTEKQKTPANADDPPAAISTDGTPAGTKKNPDELDKQPGGKKGDDDAAVHFALAYLLTTLPGQKLPVEKVAAAQIAGLSNVVTMNSSRQKEAAQVGESSSAQPATFAVLAGKGDSGISAVELSKPGSAPQITAQPLPAVARSVAGKIEFHGEKVPVAADETALKIVPEIHSAPAASAALPQTAPVLQTIETPVPAAVPKTIGTSIALQHTIMQAVPNQPIKTEAQMPLNPAAAPIAESSKHFEATAKDENSGSNQNSENSFESQEVPNSATLSLPAELTSTRETADSFSSALDRTQLLPGVVNHVFKNADWMRSDGRTNVEVQVPLRDGQNLTIELHWSNGELQPVFKTESAELRNAIEQNWSQFTSGAGERGMKITTPVFQSPQSGLGDFNQRQNREQQQQAGAWQNENFSLPSQLKSSVPNHRANAPAPAETQLTQGLALYA